MSSENDLFDHQTLMRLDAVVINAIKACRKTPLLALKGLMSLAVLSLVGVVEYEVLYQVFDVLAGDGDYWSPHLMATTAMIMIIGFHLLSDRKPDNFANRVIENLVQILIPLYLLGIGLLIGCIINMDGAGVLLESAGVPLFGIAESIQERSWIEDFYANITNPFAMLLFSTGLGGLAIVNIWVAHRLLEIISGSFSQLQSLVKEAHFLKAQRDTVRACCTQYREIGSDLAELERWDETRIGSSVAVKALEHISQALGPHRKYLQSLEYQAEPGELEFKSTINTKPIERDIKKIEAFDLKRIMKIIKTHSDLQEK